MSHDRPNREHHAEHNESRIERQKDQASVIVHAISHNDKQNHGRDGGTYNSRTEKPDFTLVQRMPANRQASISCSKQSYLGHSFNNLAGKPALPNSVDASTEITFPGTVAATVATVAAEDENIAYFKSSPCEVRQY